MRPTFKDWLAQILRTNKWVVAPRLTQRLHDKGYTVAVTQKSFTNLKAEYEATKGR